MNRDEVATLMNEAAGQAWGTEEHFQRFAVLVEDNLKHRLAEAIEKMPFGDTAASFAAFVRGFE